MSWAIITSEPVLLIKPAWGGRSLYRDFRPPIAGLPPDAVLEKMLKQAQKKKPRDDARWISRNRSARAYRAMIEEVNATLAQFENHFSRNIRIRDMSLSGLRLVSGVERHDR